MAAATVGFPGAVRHNRHDTVRDHASCLRAPRAKRFGQFQISDFPFSVLDRPARSPQTGRQEDLGQKNDTFTAADFLSRPFWKARAKRGEVARQVAGRNLLARHFPASPLPALVGRKEAQKAQEEAGAPHAIGAAIAAASKLVLLSQLLRLFAGGGFPIPLPSIPLPTVWAKPVSHRRSRPAATISRLEHPWIKAGNPWAFRIHGHSGHATFQTQAGVAERWGAKRCYRKTENPAVSQNHGYKIIRGFPPAFFFASFRLFSATCLGPGQRPKDGERSRRRAAQAELVKKMGSERCTKPGVRGFFCPIFLPEAVLSASGPWIQNVHGLENPSRANLWAFRVHGHSGFTTSKIQAGEAER